MDSSTTELRAPKINEALELALAAIDKESSSLPIQIEESFPQAPTVPSNNSTSIITTQKSLVIHHRQQHQQQQQQQQLETITLINKTDEEKFRKLHIQQEQMNIPAMLEKLEEEISKEPIYENVTTTTTTTTMVKNICENVHNLELTTSSNDNSNSNSSKTTMTTIVSPTAYEKEQQPSQIIPSVITNQRQKPIDATTATSAMLMQKNNQNCKENQNYDNCNTQNQSNQQQLQQQFSLINSFNGCETRTTATTATTSAATVSINHNNNNNISNNSNNNNNKHNNIANDNDNDNNSDNYNYNYNDIDNENNSSNDNLVELTTAFANQSIIESITTAATATAFAADNKDDIITVKITSNNNKTKTNNNNNNNNNNKNLSRDNHHANGKIFSDSSTTVTIEQNPVKALTNMAKTTANTNITSTTTSTTSNTTTIININTTNNEDGLIANTSSSTDTTEPYYQVPKSSEPYYDAPKHLKPIPVYENIEIFFNGSVSGELTSEAPHTQLQPPKEKPPPPPVDSPPLFDDDVDSPMDTNYSSSDNTYETLTRHQQTHLQQQQQQQQQQYQHQQQQQQQQMQEHHLNHSQHHPHSIQPHIQVDHPSPPMKRMNSTKRIKKELRNKRSSFLGIEGSSLDDDDSYLELTVAPPPDMAQLLQEERRLEKQLYLKAGLCDSSDTGESRDSGVSENHSRQSSEHYTNSSEENEPHDDTTSPLTLQTQIALDNSRPSDMIYQNDGLLAVAPTPLLQTVKGNSAESWTESATVAAAATQSLTEATATANAKMMSIEEKIREQEEVLRVERELLQLEQEELKRQRENLMLRETMARRELQHGAKMLMSANRRSLQDLNGLGSAMTVITGGGNVDIGGSMLPANNVDIYHMNQMNGYGGSQHYHSKSQLGQQLPQQTNQQQIYANIPNLQQQYYQSDTDYRKSMSDINEFSKHMMQPPVPPSKPMRAMHMTTANRLINGTDVESSAEFNSRQRHSLNSQHFGGSLVKIATAQPTAAPRGGPPHIYSNFHHQSAQNLNASAGNLNHHAPSSNSNQSMYPGNMSRNTLHALSATPKPKYTDGWVQVQQRKSYDTNFANDPAWVSAYQQKRKSMPDASYHQFNGGNNHWLVQEAEQRRLAEQQQRRVVQSSTATTPVHQQSSTHMSTNGNSTSNGKPLPDSIIQTLTERVQSKGIGERKRNLDKSPLHAASQYHQYGKGPQQQQQQPPHQIPNSTQNHILHSQAAPHNQPQHQSAGNVVATHRHQHTSSASMTSAPTTNGQLNSSTTSAASAVTSISTAANSTSQDKVLSVSGKKKCSHCGDELGRGAAMIIESLLLFYHINCFKCCVCHVQLGDGLNGTDVRVRNHKLHCQNCYSSDDGIKFSCV